MRNIADNRFFHMILLFTIIGEFIVPWILGRFYSEYNGKIMVMSVLGNPQSPVRLVYNIWLGGFLAYTKKFQVTVIENIDKKRGNKAYSR